ncbi:MAG: carbohydrate ABC transporter permease [Acetatifactor sp.]|nr:carbohydrate ABC transporter permease [Acetatifactor sp.]
MEDNAKKAVYVKPKTKIAPFAIFNTILFIIISIIILIPIWKVLMDSFDATSGYGLKLWPQRFTLGAYKMVVTRSDLYLPFLISIVVTVAGSFLGLLLSTLGAYVLIQWEMPGRNLFSWMLLFTMLFSGGMIPTYVVMMNLHLTNTLWSVILPLAINVYNLVLMRNFFEGIPASLYESAKLDGCSPMGIFFKIVLPLSKAALAAIGLMFAVTYWNDYTNFKIYITNNRLFNFQMKLRAMVMDSDLPGDDGSLSPNTLQNAAVIVAIIPFMILYPFCQDYFVQGVNAGAVKE